MKTKTYYIWRVMRQRCEKLYDKNYKNYGARGISVCDRWQKFSNFLADMGEKPDGKMLDRINNNEGYSKENCRWSSVTEQIRNRRNTLFIEWRGERRPLAEWAEIIGVKYKCLSRRYHLGWSIDKMLSYTPSLNRPSTSSSGTTGTSK